MIADIRFDAVLITHLVGVDEKTVYHPATYRPASYHGSFYGYYDHVGGSMYEPGYYRRHTYVKLETNLYDARSEALVWSMQSETIDPSSVQKLILPSECLFFVFRIDQHAIVSRWRASDEHKKTDQSRFFRNHHPDPGGIFRSDGHIPRSKSGVFGRHDHDH